MAKATVEATIAVTLDSGEETAAGTLYATGDDLSFRYDAQYSRTPGSFDLFPSLPRSLAPFFFPGLGPFSDSAPDRWGRKVLARSRKRTRISESEYLFGVNDLTRQGAIRFLVDGIPVAGDEGVPVLASLPELLATADAVEQDREVSDTALRRLYRATGSLGGARPKASVLDQGMLWLAKFPKPNGDDWDIIGWEAITLEIARLAGITVPDHRTLTIVDHDGRDRTILLTRRFDRRPSSRLSEARRIPYMSAMTALESTDGDGGDWLDLVEFTRSTGGDTKELWRRAVFGAAIGNLDDHLRNHGFLRDSGSWRLAPAFDMNPEPYEEGIPDTHQLALLGEPDTDIDNFMDDDALALFDVPYSSAEQWLGTLRSALAQAIPRAQMRRIDRRSIDMMAGRFDHALSRLR